LSITRTKVDEDNGLTALAVGAALIVIISRSFLQPASDKAINRNIIIFFMILFFFVNNRDFEPDLD
jgi:hypothetical protein